MKHKEITTRVVQWITACTLAAMLMFACYTPTHAATIIYAEDFSNPLEKTWRVRWNQQWGNTSQPCMNGITPAVWARHQDKIHLELNGLPCVIDFVPEHLDLRQIGKYSLSVRVAMPESIWMNRSIAFLWQDPQNWYDVQLYGDRVSLQKWVQGQAYSLPGSLAHLPFQPNQSYHFTIEVTQQQHIRVKVGEQVILDVHDQPPYLPSSTSKSIALRGSLGATTHSIMDFDDVQIAADIPSTQLLSLNTPLFKQNDNRWGAQEYDSANSWSPVPSISRWGCAMTSMAMVLHYHGITKFPDGQAITPFTLNQWLKEQPDGYFSGNLNWHAVTRLTRLVHAKYRTPKLEFTRADGSHAQVVEWAKSELIAKKPVILGVPGHFFVADGINYLTHTLQIKDPLFSYSQLSQHSKELTTIRRFQPSYTDLSYLLFIVPKEVEIKVRDTQGHEVATERSSEYIQDQLDEDGARSPQVDQVYIPKPSSGKYSVTVTQPEHKAYQLEVLSYDTEGNVQMRTQQGTVGPEGETFPIQFEKHTTAPSPTTNISWDSFRQHLQKLSSQRKIKYRFVVTYLDRLAQYARKSPPRHQLLYIRVLQQSLDIYRPFIETQSYRQLSRQLESLREQANHR